MPKAVSVLLLSVSSGKVVVAVSDMLRSASVGSRKLGEMEVLSEIDEDERSDWSEAPLLLS